MAEKLSKAAKRAAQREKAEKEKARRKRAREEYADFNRRTNRRLYES